MRGETIIVKAEYSEGPETAKNFERLATQMFRAPKPKSKLTKKPVRKPKEKPGKD